MSIIEDIPVYSEKAEVKYGLHPGFALVLGKCCILQVSTYHGPTVSMREAVPELLDLILRGVS